MRALRESALIYWLTVPTQKPAMSRSWLEAGAQLRPHQRVVFTYCFPGCVLPDSWKREPKLWLKPRHSSLEQGHLTLTSRPGARPLHYTWVFLIFYNFKKSKTYLFMLTQDVSKIPINLKTPSRMSLIISGGMRRERISERDSGLMFPTASLASLTKGYNRKRLLLLSNYILKKIFASYFM